MSSPAKLSISPAGGLLSAGTELTSKVDGLAVEVANHAVAMKKIQRHGQGLAHEMAQFRGALVPFASALGQLAGITAIEKPLAAAGNSRHMEVCPELRLPLGCS